MKKNYFILCLVITLSFFTSKATTIIIGTGVITNTFTGYPAPYGNYFWGAKHQFLILASELNTAGMTTGNINSLAFNVSLAIGMPLEGFTISMKNTLATNLTSFQTGLITVYNPQTFSESNGLNTHVFSTPFFWDGTSNLIVQTCFNNTSYTQNARMLQSSTTFSSSIWRIDDQSNVCSNTTSLGSMNQRPNMVFDWTGANLPPITNFTGNSYSCTGVVSFTDLTVNNPTSWSWHFGDGATSSLKNPTHTYSSNGTYSVSLKTCNSYGCDSLYSSNFVTVNTSLPLPITASCTPSTLSYCCGFGITNVIFNTISNSSNNAVDSYSDFTCTQTTVLKGQNYSLSILSTAPANQNYGAWIDFNNDGIFNNTTERVLTVSSQLNANGIVSIPAGAVVNTPLRMRITADYDFSSAPTPCSNSDYGQTEDYTVIVIQNNNPPISAFTSNVTTTCSGTVCFTDQSTNIPTGWLWNFGDGNTSLQQNPCHTYLTNGTYSVSLTVNNSNGSNTQALSNYITVNRNNQVTAAACSPITLSYCCRYGIYNVKFNTINNTTADASEGYKDFSCTNITTINQASSYVLSVNTGTDNPQDTRVWIDFNNDGVFNNTNELILNAPNANNPSINYTIPAGSVKYTPLRMRVSSDIVGVAQSGCTNNDYGQTEDYGVIVQNPLNVNKFNHLSFLNLYPNPSTGILNIETNNDPENYIIALQIVNVVGQISKQQSFGENQSHIVTDISELPKGIYFVNIKTQSGSVVKQLILQ